MAVSVASSQLFRDYCTTTFLIPRVLKQPLGRKEARELCDLLSLPNRQAQAGTSVL
jgi:hypothetical protein